MMLDPYGRIATGGSITQPPKETNENRVTYEDGEGARHSRGSLMQPPPNVARHQNMYPPSAPPISPRQTHELHNQNNSIDPVHFINDDSSGDNAPINKPSNSAAPEKEFPEKEVNDIINKVNFSIRINRFFLECIINFLCRSVWSIFYYCNLAHFSCVMSNVCPCCLYGSCHILYPE